MNGLMAGTLTLVFGVLFLFPADAWAYLDPGAGSMLLQLLLGGIAGLAVVLKVFWKRIMDFFRQEKEND